MTCSQDDRNFPFAPMRLPPNTLRHVGSFKKSDGSVGKIMRLPAEIDPTDNGPLAWEQEMPLFDIDVSSIKVQPMPVPSGAIFYQDFGFGDALRRDDDE